MQIHRRPCQPSAPTVGFSIFSNSNKQRNKYLICIYPRKQFGSPRLWTSDRQEKHCRWNIQAFKTEAHKPIITWNQPPTTAYSTETTTYFTKTRDSTVHIDQSPHSNIPTWNHMPNSLEYQPRLQQFGNKIKRGKKRHHVEKNGSDDSMNRLKT